MRIMPATTNLSGTVSVFIKLLPCLNVQSLGASLYVQNSLGCSAILMLSVFHLDYGGACGVLVAFMIFNDI